MLMAALYISDTIWNQSALYPSASKRMEMRYKGRLRLFSESTALVWVFIAEMKHFDQKASWGGKGLFGLHFYIAAHY